MSLSHKEDEISRISRGERDIPTVEAAATPNSQLLVNIDGNGEIDGTQEIQTYIKATKRYFKKGTFVVMKKNFIAKLLGLYGNDCYNLTLLEMKVVAYMIDNIDFNNRIQSFIQSDIAEACNSSQPKISGVLQKLIDKKILKRIGRDYYFTETFLRFANDEKNPKPR